VPVALICCVFPTATDGVDGASATVVNFGPMKNPLHPKIAGPINAHSNRAIMEIAAAPFPLSRTCFCLMDQPSSFATVVFISS
jgi:hypothetical protein